MDPKFLIAGINIFNLEMNICTDLTWINWAKFDDFSSLKNTNDRLIENGRVFLHITITKSYCQLW